MQDIELLQVFQGIATLADSDPIIAAARIVLQLFRSNPGSMLERAMDTASAAFAILASSSRSFWGSTLSSS